MCNNNDSIFICSGTINLKFAQQVADCLKKKINLVKVGKYPDGEIYVQYIDNPKCKDVFIIQPICCSFSDSIIELSMLIDGARRIGAERITAVIPYYGYGRQDKLDKFGIAIGAKTISDIITNIGADRILTLDLHSPQITGFFNIPIDNMRMAYIISPYIKRLFNIQEELVIVAPDIGSVKMGQIFKEQLKCAELAVIIKKRNSSNIVESSHLVGNVYNKICLLVDDIISTASTIISAKQILVSEKAKRVFAFISHCMLNDIGVKNILKSDIDKLIVTDSIPFSFNTIKTDNIAKFSVTNVFAKAILDIHNNSDEYYKYIFDMS